MNKVKKNSLDEKIRKLISNEIKENRKVLKKVKLNKELIEAKKELDVLLDEYKKATISLEILREKFWEKAKKMVKYDEIQRKNKKDNFEIFLRIEEDNTIEVIQEKEMPSIIGGMFSSSDIE